MDIPAPHDPFLADALAAAEEDADFIHHDLCEGAGRGDADVAGPCSCGVPDLIRVVSLLLDGQVARAVRRRPVRHCGY